MGLLSAILGDSEDEVVEEKPDKSECDTREGTVEVFEEFTRRTVTFHFVRGESATMTYDVADARPMSRYVRVSKGTRGEVRVEKFCRVVGGEALGKDLQANQKMIRPEVEQVGEVTPSNVAAREVDSEVDMELAAVADVIEYLHPGTGEILYREVPDGDGRTFDGLVTGSKNYDFEVREA